jgi:1-acyl-sn-glycerol-3-phosphate acyltransferase
MRAVATVFFIAIVTAVGSVWGIVLRLFDPTGDKVLDLARAWSGWVTSFAGVKIVVENRAKLEPTQPYVFMSNHASSLDIWTVFVAVPRRIRLIAKKQLGRIPLLGWVMRAGRFIFIDRGNGVAARRSIEEAGQRIHNGSSVLLFPEGTRTRDGALLPFKKGGFHLAVKAGVPIVPIALRGTRALMPAGSYLCRAGVVTAIIGEPISTQNLTDEERAGLGERVRGIIEGMLASK